MCGESFFKLPKIREGSCFLARQGIDMLRIKTRAAAPGGFDVGERTRPERTLQGDPGFIIHPYIRPETDNSAKSSGIAFWFIADLLEKITLHQ